jgi:hypothetical protein
MEFEFQYILDFGFVKLNYWIIVLLDPKLELQPLDYQISVLLDLELKLVFPCTQMHSPLHINFTKLLNSASYDCHHYVDICKWWLTTIATLNLINLPKWLHLIRKKKNPPLLFYVQAR